MYRVLDTYVMHTFIIQYLCMNERETHICRSGGSHESSDPMSLVKMIKYKVLREKYGYRAAIAQKVCVV